MPSIKNKQKILVLVISFILISTVFISAAGSKSTYNPLNNPKPKPSPLGNFLQNLVDRFPVLADLMIIQMLLKFLNGDDDGGDPPGMCHPDVEVGKQVKFNCCGSYDTTIIVDVGSWVTFKIIVENTGQTPLDITVRDDLPNGLVYNNNAYVNDVLTPPDEIGGDYYWYLYDVMPGNITTITFRADVPECGEFENYVNVTAEYDGVTVYDDATAIVIAPCDGNPDIKIEKTVSPESICAGQSVDYTYTITNTGDMYLKNIVLVDDQLLGSITLPKTALAPLEQMTATEENVVLYEDTTNIATVTGETNDSQVVTNESQAFVDVLIPSINLTKEADLDVAEVGDTITYTYNVTNDGEVDLTGVSLLDDLLGTITLADTELEPMESTTGVKTYVVQESDLPGPILNTAIVTGYPPCGCGDPVQDQDSESVDLFYCCDPSIDLVKEANVDIAEVGDTITYTYTVTNDGNSRLTNVQLTDDKLGSVTLGTTTLEPTQSTTGQKTYVVKLSDLPGPIINTAIATGIADCDPHQKVRDEDSESVEVIRPCADPVWVDDDWFSQTHVNTYNPALIWGYNAFRDIQDGIDAVCPCGTVYVRPGLYTGQFLINKSLELLGEPGARIHGNVLQTFTIDGTGSFRPVIFAFAGTLVGHNVVSSGSYISVKVDGFEITGDSEAIAVLYHNVQNGCVPNQISNNKIYGVKIGLQLNGCTTETLVIYNKMYWTNSGHTAVLLTPFTDCEPTDVKINYNYWGAPCSDNIGVNNTGTESVDARYNWWASDDGPSSLDANYPNLDAVTDRPADGFGDKVIGPVQFDPWYGVDSYGTVSRTTARVGELILFDGSDSFGYDENGYIPDKTSTTPGLEYKWDFDDGHYSFSKIINRAYSVPGTYHVSLLVETSSYDLDPDFVSGFLRDWSYFTIVVTP